MINNKKIIAIIPARAGSKGIKKKNLYSIAGSPLIYWTISEIKKINFIDKVVITSDDYDIINYCKSLNCDVPFRRSDELSTDEAKTSDVILDVLKRLPGYDYFILLQPTSPLRTASDIMKAFDKMISSNSKTCISVYKTSLKANWLLKLNNHNNLKPMLDEKYFDTRRQEMDDTYLPNGAIYISETKNFIKNKNFFSSKTTAFVMPEEMSIDIDNINQMKKCEKILKKRNRKLAGMFNQLDEGVGKFNYDEINERI